MGKNASGQTHYLSLSGLEIYGTVTGVCEDQLGKCLLLLYSFNCNICVWVKVSLLFVLHIQVKQ